MHDGAAYPGLRIRPSPALPVAQMVIGQPVDKAAALLPRLFNLCRVAQGTAARGAFGLPLDTDWQAALRAEIQREHVAKLCLKWPALLSLPAVSLPRGWGQGGAEARRALFGPSGVLPTSGASFSAFLDSGVGVAPVLRAISQVFAPGEACREALPTATNETFFASGPKENSVAGRQSHRPALRWIEARWGRGPFWSATALAFDLQDTLDGHLPTTDIAPGRAIIPAARGFYGITARVSEGRVTQFERITPTDHLVAPGGALAQSLASLPADRAQALAPLVLAILDPCHPVALEPTAQKEPCDA